MIIENLYICQPAEKVYDNVNSSCQSQCMKKKQISIDALNCLYKSKGIWLT